MNARNWGAIKLGENQWIRF